MEEIIKLRSEFITLGQLLKLTGEISNGGHIKFFLEENDVYVNNELERRRGRKLYQGDKIKINNNIFVIN